MPTFLEESLSDALSPLFLMPKDFAHIVISHVNL